MDSVVHLKMRKDIVVISQAFLRLPYSHLFKIFPHVLHHKLKHRACPTNLIEDPGNGLRSPAFKQFLLNQCLLRVGVHDIVVVIFRVFYLPRFLALEHT